MSSSDWMEVKLGEICHIIMGQSPKGETCNSIRIGTPLLNGPTEFGSFQPKAVQYTTDVKKQSVKGDILFCVRGSTTGRMNWSDKEYAIGRGLAAIRHKSGVEYSHFVKGLIDYKLDEILSFANGSTFPNVSKDLLNYLSVYIPPINEQKAISDTLKCLDDKIKLNNKINKSLEKMAQAFFQSWFIDFEPFQEGEFVDSELGRIPKAYEVKKIGDLDIIVTDYVANGSFASLKQNVTLHTDKNYAVFVRNVDLKSNKFEKYVDEHSYKFLSKSRLFGNEVIISNVGDVGSVFLCPKLSIPMTLGNNMIMLNSLNQEYLNYYLYILFKYFYGQDLIKSITGGSAQPKFNKTDFKACKIIVPSKEHLVQFNEIVKVLFSIECRNLNESDTIESIKSSLLPKLMSGEIRVPIEEVQ